MRTPNTYGYFTATYTPIKPLSIALSGTYTGSMLVPHEPVPGFLEKPITVNTKDFFDIGLKAAYDFKLYKSMNLQVNAVIQNIFNAYRMTLTREPTVIRAIFMVLHCREVSLRE